MSAFPWPAIANMQQRALLITGKVIVTRQGGGFGESLMGAIHSLSSLSSAWPINRNHICLRYLLSQVTTVFLMITFYIYFIYFLLFLYTIVFIAFYIFPILLFKHFIKSYDFIILCATLFHKKNVFIPPHLFSCYFTAWIKMIYL